MEHHRRALRIIGEILNPVTVIAVRPVNLRHRAPVERVVSRIPQISSQDMNDVSDLFIGKVELLPKLGRHRLDQGQPPDRRVNVGICMHRYRNASLIQRGGETFQTILLCNGTHMTLNWLQGPDLNRRPSGYDPDELPGCSTLRSITLVN